MSSAGVHGRCVRAGDTHDWSHGDATAVGTTYLWFTLQNLKAFFVHLFFFWFFYTWLDFVSLFVENEKKKLKEKIKKKVLMSRMNALTEMQRRWHGVTYLF